MVFAKCQRSKLRTLPLELERIRAHALSVTKSPLRIQLSHTEDADMNTCERIILGPIYIYIYIYLSVTICEFVRVYST